jgi:regulator of replication initiation timing
LYKPEEHTAIINQILENHTDQAQVSTLLAQLSKDYTETITEVETAKNTATKLTTDNENLRKANYDLFAQLGQRLPQKTETTPQPNTDNKALSYEALFDKDGNLL